MSKSVGNIVDPNHLISTYGADTARLFILFAAPPDQSLEWSDAGVEGAYRFLKRLWAFGHKHQGIIEEINELYGEDPNAIHWQQSSERLKKSRQLVHQLLLQATQDYERQQFNTVVSACMKLFNELSSYDIESELDRCFIHASMSILLRLLAPITPHITHALWQNLGYSKAIIDASWPRVDKNALKTNEVEFIVQINGKRKGQFIASPESAEAVLIEQAIESVASFIKMGTLQKSIVVMHRQLINLVIK